MSNARDERDRIEHNPKEEHTFESVFSPTEEIGIMHFTSGNLTTALEYFHKALESPENSTDTDQFRLLLRVFDCHQQKGNNVEAGAFLEDAKAILKKIPAKENISKIEYRQAFLLLARGDYDEALKLSFSAYRKLKDSLEHAEVARIQTLIAHCYMRLGFLTEAEEFFTDALSAYRRAENRVGIAYIYNNLGILHKNACRWTRALASHSKSLEIAKTLGMTQQLIAVQLNLGIVYGKLRRFEEAISSLNASLTSAERFGDQFRVTKALLVLGRTYAQIGEYTKSEKHLLRAQAIAEEFGYTRETTLAEEYMGELMIARGSYQDALANLRSALKRARKFAPEGDVTAESLRRLADVEYYLNRPIDALAHVEEGIEIASNCGEIYELGYFFRAQGLCHSRLGKTEAALASLKKSIEMFEQYGNPYEKVRSQQVLARLYGREKSDTSLVKAKQALNDSIIEANKLEDSFGQIVSQILLAGVEQRLGNMDDALLAVYEADRVAEEEDATKFRRALLALRKKIEAHMSRSSTSVVDQFSILGDIQNGARSREQLVKGLSSTLNLIIERLNADAGFIAIPNATNGKTLQIVSREQFVYKEAQGILSWFTGEAKKNDSPAGGLLITDLENNPEAEQLRGRLSKPAGTLLVQSLGFESEDLGVLCVHRTAGEARNPMGQDGLNFVAAYASLISLSIYEIVRSEQRGRIKPSSSGKGFQRIVTDNEEMIKLLNLSERVAHSDATVLLQGETGTGKGLIAYAVHLLSERRDREFMHVNCAAMPEQLLESELFGHVRGSFTGAFADKQGLLHRANGGTIFLDEIGKTSLAMQGKLLQFLDTSKVRKVGSNELELVDVRVICASKVNLLQLCNEGRFLEDLFYRINDFPLTVPPLRDRVGDVVLLMYHYLDKLSREMGKEINGVTDEFVEKLKAYRWPGNVRELEKVVKRAIILADDGDTLSAVHLPPDGSRARNRNAADAQGAHRTNRADRDPRGAETLRRQQIPGGYPPRHQLSESSRQDQAL